MPLTARYGAERRWRVLVEFGVGKAAEVTEIVFYVVINPDVVLIAVEGLGTGRNEIVVIRSGSPEIRQRQERDQVRGGRRQTACWDLVIGELDPAASIGVATVRVENRHAKRAEITKPLSGCGHSVDV